MTTVRRIPLAIAATALIAIPAAASGQIRDAASVPVSVRLEVAPDPPLVLRIDQPLSFGTVSMPNRVTSRVACRYDLRSNGTTTTSTGNPFDGATNGSARLASGCRQIGATPARIALTCEPGRLMRGNIRVVPSALTGISFSQRNPEANSIDRGGGNVSAIGDTFGLTCDLAAGNTEMVIRMGGQLIVSRNEVLPVNAVVQVASVEIDMVYL